jgi:hypothetical protein
MDVFVLHQLCQTVCYKKDFILAGNSTLFPQAAAIADPFQRSNARPIIER